jgi:hypothetical protein
MSTLTYLFIVLFLAGLYFYAKYTGTKYSESFTNNSDEIAKQIRLKKIPVPSRKKNKKEQMIICLMPIIHDENLKIQLIPWQ